MSPGTALSGLPLSLVALVFPLDVVGGSSIAAGTVVLGHQLPALLTAHRAAPVELAVAAGDHLRPPLLHFEATLGAEPPAAPLLPLREVLAGLQALAALSAVVAQAGVPRAVVRGVLQEDELCGVDVVEGLCRGPAAVGAVAGSHPPLVHLQLVGLVVFHLEVVPNLSELSELEPARLDAAAARHPVAFAGSLHRSFHSLGRKGEEVRSSGSLPFTFQNWDTWCFCFRGSGSNVTRAGQDFRSFQGMNSCLYFSSRQTSVCPCH